MNLQSSNIMKTESKQLEYYIDCESKPCGLNLLVELDIPNKNEDGMDCNK